MNEKNLKYNRLIAKWLVDKTNDTENELLMKFFDNNQNEKRTAEELKVIWQLSRSIDIPKGISEMDRWKNIKDHIEKKKTTPHFSVKNRLYRFAAAAAVFLIVAGTTYLYFYNDIRINIPNAQIKTIILPDQSELTINAGSTIRYNQLMWRIRRSIQLQGEAFFKVRKSQNPFIAKTNNARIEVLGTSFNIESRNDKTEVSCLSGKVKISNKVNRNKYVVLAKGFVSDIYKNKLPTEPSEENGENVISWIYGNLYFNETPVIEVFKELERHYNIEVVFEKKKYKYTYSGFLSKLSADEAIGIICLSLGIKFTHQGDRKYVIK